MLEGWGRWGHYGCPIDLCFFFSFLLCLVVFLSSFISFPLLLYTIMYTHPNISQLSSPFAISHPLHILFFRPSILRRCKCLLWCNAVSFLPSFLLLLLL